MTIHALLQDSHLKYIAPQELNSENIKDLTGLARQYAEDVLRITQVALNYLDERNIAQNLHVHCADSVMVGNNRNIQLCNELIEKNTKIIDLTEKYGKLYDKNESVTVWKMLAIISLVVVSVYIFFMIAHEAKWIRIFKSW